MMAFESAPLNSVISPTFLPGDGNNRTASGLFHLYASVATSPTIRAMASSLVSPATGGKPREVLVDKGYFAEVDAQLR